jgi:hypothetical protein
MNDSCKGQQISKYIGRDRNKKFRNCKSKDKEENDYYLMMLLLSSSLK